MPLPSRAEHEVVARRAPRRLLDHFDVRHAVFGEQAFFLGDEQRRGIAQRDEAEDGLGDLRARALRERAGGEIQPGGGEHAAVPAAAFRSWRRLRPRREVGVVGFVMGIGVLYVSA